MINSNLDIRFKISDCYITVDNINFPVGVVLGPKGNPEGLYADKIITNTEYLQGLKDNIFGLPIYDDLIFHCVAYIRTNTNVPYEIEQKWIDELVMCGCDVSKINYKSIF